VRQRARRKRARCGQSRSQLIETLQAELRLERRARQNLEETSVTALHHCWQEVVPKRVIGEQPVPEGFDNLVALLDEPAPSLLPVYDPSVDTDTNRTRAALRHQQALLRQAEHSAQPAVIADRDRARKDHVAALGEAQGKILLASNTTTIAGLSSAIIAADAAIARTELAMRTARAAAIKEPQLGSQAAAPRNLDGEIETCRINAVAAYRDYISTCSSAQVIANTDEAVQMVHLEFRNSQLFLPTAGCAGEYALNSLHDAVRGAHRAIDIEATFWQGLDEVASLPCGQLLAAGRAAYDLHLVSRASLHALREKYEALSAELQDEEEALAPERSRDPAIAALAQAAESHLDTNDVLQDALLAVQRAKIRGKPVEALEEKASAAKELSRSAGVEVRKAMEGLAAAMRHFPEVSTCPEVMQHLRVSLPQDLVYLWCMGRTLGQFSSRELLPAASKHRLYRVTEGDRTFAVKEYAVAGGQDGLQICLHEAALLTRARHPHIVEIVALFADPEEHGFFIQMPFYEHGSLDQWVAKQRPDDLSVRKVLYQVVTALAHLHGLGIVHADIKPGNILLDARGVARLGDFDVSVDSGTRTSAARAHATMTQVGFTPGFAAPELLRSGATAATDLFALGATIMETAPQSPERDLLVKSLQAPEPMSRFSAQQVLQEPFFAPVFSWAKDERRSCCICLEDNVPLEEGIQCSRTDGACHFVCRDCLERHVEATVGAEMRARRANEGRVRCPGRPCDATAYPDVDLAKHLSAQAFQKYTESRVDLLEQRRAAELEVELQARLDAELRRIHALDEQQRRIRTVRYHITENILTLKCPRCGQAFLDFIGCFALQCSRCPCGFCAWCGADSGSSNAHDHVRVCREKPPGADVFFGTFEQFEAAQRRRRRWLLQNYLSTLDPQTRAAVLHEIRRDLADLGLDDLMVLQQPVPPPPNFPPPPPPVILAAQHQHQWVQPLRHARLRVM